MDTVTARGSGLLTLTNHRAQASETAWVVPGAGIEPARLSPQDFKSCMSTYFIIRATITAPDILSFDEGHR